MKKRSIFCFSLHSKWIWRNCLREFRNYSKFEAIHYINLSWNLHTTDNISRNYTIKLNNWRLEIYVCTYMYICMYCVLHVFFIGIFSNKQNIFNQIHNFVKFWSFHMLNNGAKVYLCDWIKPCWLCLMKKCTWTKVSKQLFSS